MVTLNDDVTIYHAQNYKIKLTQTEEIITQKTPLWNLDRIVLPYRDKKYQYKYDGTGVDVYILDTGIRVTHQEFQFTNNNITYSRASCGWDAYGSSCNDRDGHGSHVAGTVGGNTYGVAKNVNLISVKVLSDLGNGTLDDSVKGIDWVTDQKLASPDIPVVINLSLDSEYNDYFNDAVQAAYYFNVTVVAAAGNDGDDACFYSPGSAPDAITVGATGSTDRRPFYSNYGTCVDILAPGSNIISVGVISDTAQTTKTGTSMATPHVAGSAAILFSHFPTCTVTEIRYQFTCPSRRWI